MVRAMELRIASPCTANWDRMQGDNRVRYCPECKLNVYNFEAITDAEIEQIVRTHEGRLCARFYSRTDGTLMTQNCPVGFRAAVRRFSRVAGVVFSTAVAVINAGFAAAQTKSYSSRSDQAQHSDATVLLELMDPTGAVIANARVLLLDSRKKIVHEGRTSSKGQLLIPHLAAAPYSVLIVVPGFSTYRQEVYIHAAQTMKVVAKLNLAVLMGEVVQVEGSTPVFDPVRIP